MTDNQHTASDDFEVGAILIGLGSAENFEQTARVFQNMNDEELEQMLQEVKVLRQMDEGKLNHLRSAIQTIRQMSPDEAKRFAKDMKEQRKKVQDILDTPHEMTPEKSQQIQQKIQQLSPAELEELVESLAQDAQFDDAQKATLRETFQMMQSKEIE